MLFQYISKTIENKNVTLKKLYYFKIVMTSVK